MNPSNLSIDQAFIVIYITLAAAYILIHFTEKASLKKKRKKAEEEANNYVIYTTATVLEDYKELLDPVKKTPNNIN